MNFKITRQIRNEAISHLNKLKDKTAFVRIFNIIDPLRIEFEKKDFFVTNYFENKARKKNINNYKKLCEIDIKDILDINPLKYSKEDTNKIVKAIDDIQQITDRTFWEKIKSVFRGS